MDIEQLKIVVNLVSSLGGDARTAFIAWLIVVGGQGYFWGIGLLGTLVYLVKTVAVPLISSAMAGERLRKAAGVNYRWSDGEIVRACNVLRKYSGKIYSDQDD